MTWQLESTARCTGAPIAMLALRELDRPFERVVRPDGYFLSTYGVAGPVLRREGAVVVGLAAILAGLRSESPRLWPAEHATDIDRWIRAALSEAGPAAYRLQGGAEGDERSAALTTLKRTFAAIDAQLARGPFLCGDTLTAADLPWLAIPASGPLGAMLPERVRAYTERLRARAGA